LPNAVIEKGGGRREEGKLVKKVMEKKVSI
jgi:hypothetical protein